MLLKNCALWTWMISNNRVPKLFNNREMEKLKAMWADGPLGRN